MNSSEEDTMQIIEHSIVGVRSAVTRLRRRGTKLEFVVFPMLHVAMPSFYAEVTERLLQCDLLVVEGIIDLPADGDAAETGGSARGLLALSALTATYRSIAANRDSGLVEDPIPYGELGVPVITPDMTTAEVGEGIHALPLKTKLQIWGATPLAAVMNYFNGRQRLLTRNIEINDLPSAAEELESEDAAAFRELFIGRRDEQVLTALADLVETRADEQLRVAVVYGGAHIPGIVHGLSRLGYRPIDAEWLTAVAA
ncbi:hypothetical protein AB0P21_40560 [Kribbella sp. NPDC056861]|uniref:hypothetical protein n=1 Tax=Kribbella sp. NPDC056861 TaxID=3154857 RepID=UPI00341A42FE